MYSEMLVELQGSSGTFYFSGDAARIWTDRGPSSGKVSKKALCIREPASWEKELLVFRSPRPRTETGPPLLGEESTLFFWSEDHPGWVFVETEEGAWIDRLSLWPWAEALSVCWRPDSRTVRYRFPSALLAFNQEEMVLQEIFS